TYAELNQKKNALKYSALQISIAEKEGNRVAYYRALLNKAYILFLLNQYKSALVLTDKLTIKITFKSIFELPALNEIGKEAYRLKAVILAKLKSKSFWEYQN